MENPNKKASEPQLELDAEKQKIGGLEASLAAETEKVKNLEASLKTSQDKLKKSEKKVKELEEAIGGYQEAAKELDQLKAENAAYKQRESSKSQEGNGNSIAFSNPKSQNLSGYGSFNHEGTNYLIIAKSFKYKGKTITAEELATDAGLQTEFVKSNVGFIKKVEG
jgi:septal ring factor EnvC (AmiA/AmiB activator)